MSEDNDSLARVRRGVDFLAWSKRTQLRFDRIVANPPYLALRSLSGVLLDSALSTIVPVNGKPVPHRANCWYAFLCAAIGLLRDGGSLAFVLPAAWDYADYAAPMRAGIAKLFRAIKNYRSVHPLFSGVQEGAVVLVAEGYRAQNRLPETRQVYEQANAMFRAVARGHGKPLRSTSALAPSTASCDKYLVSDILTVRIGAVTGDARYFLLNEKRRRDLGIPLDAVVPALSRASHLRSAEVTREDWQRLRDSGDRVWMFRPPPRLMRHPSVRRYLALAVEDGGCERTAHHVKKREPAWYRVRLPELPDGFVSGMGRYGPWIALRRDVPLTATNTLYAVRFRRRCSATEMYAWALMLFCAAPQEQMERVLRQYPDGLSKVEPGDFGRIIIPRPRRIRGAMQAYREAVACFLAGDRAGATLIANRLAR